MTLYTIGHSTRTAEEFLELLRRQGVRQLVDVRAFPGSRRHPHFGREALSAFLSANDVAYVHSPELGGRRRLRPDATPSAWRNPSFAAYADYMMTPQFAGAIDQLLGRAAEQRTTIMCSEAVPWRCHRSMISDAVVARGHEVLHILETSVSSHVLTSFAVIQGCDVRYPPEAEEQPELPLSGA
jgi:uncharacterized protein (DUF488 family)